MNGKVGIYLRGEKIIIIPEGGSGGYSYDMEPVFVIEATEGEVSKVVDQALSISSRGSPLPPPHKPSISPTLKKLGLRSYKDLYRNAAHCYLYEEGDNLIMHKFVPASDGRGFELADAPPVPIKNRQEVGAIVVEYLKHAPKMASS